MIKSMKLTLQLQNGIAEKEGNPSVPLRDWGLLLVQVGLSAIACSEQEEQTNAAT
jgi:hypothetical protein